MDRGLLQGTSCTISSHHCRCFEKLTKEEAGIIEENSVHIRYNKKEIICKQGSFVSHVMFIEEGLAKVFLDNGSNTLVLKIIPSGNLLGLSSMSEDNNTFQYSAMAYVESVVKLIDIKVFRQLLSQNAAFAREVIEILGANSVQIYSRFFCLTHKQAHGRLADILLCLANRIFKSDVFDLPLSRKDLAELSGMTSETVIRMLKKFHDDGLIRIEGKTFRIIDYSRLQKISEVG